MTLLVDSGSSRLHIARWNGVEVLEAVTVEYPDGPDALAGLLRQFLNQRKPDRIAACSVAGRWRGHLFETLERFAPARLHVARTAMELGIRVRYRNPATMGIDRALAVYAAWRCYGSPCVVVDAGTAITVDAVGGEGVMLGGYIIPGAALMAGSLAAYTVLPNVTTSGAADSPGDSTEACIGNGIVVSMRAGVSRLIELAAEYAGASRTIMTGGGGEALHEMLEIDAEYRPWLVLEGLGLALDAGKVPVFVDDHDNY